MAAVHQLPAALSEILLRFKRIRLPIVLFDIYVLVGIILGKLLMQLCCCVAIDLFFFHTTCFSNICGYLKHLVLCLLSIDKNSCKTTKLVFKQLSNLKNNCGFLFIEFVRQKCSFKKKCMLIVAASMLKVSDDYIQTRFFCMEDKRSNTSVRKPASLYDKTFVNDFTYPMASNRATKRHN